MDIKEKFIMLIDGDNINFTHYNPIKEYLSKQGSDILEVHLFGKLASKYIHDWKNYMKPGSVFIECPIIANHKNSTDIQIISIICQKYHIDGFRNFCVLSSDSDFGYILTTLPPDCNLLVGYCKDKVSTSYLKYLASNNIKAVDLDEIRGPITGEIKDEMINTVLRSYIEYKLSNSFFDYATLMSWLKHRFGNNCVGSIDEVQKLCRDKMLQFTPDGVVVCDTGKDTVQ